MFDVLRPWAQLLAPGSNWHITEAFIPIALHQVLMRYVAWTTFFKGRLEKEFLVHSDLTARSLWTDRKIGNPKDTKMGKWEPHTIQSFPSYNRIKLSHNLSDNK
jgi:hypothetical protein